MSQVAIRKSWQFYPLLPLQARNQDHHTVCKLSLYSALYPSKTYTW